MTRRPWTAAEREFLHAMYAEWGAPECAAALDRPTHSVHNQAVVLGLTRPRTEVTPPWLAEVRRLNGLGWPDGEIAAHLGADRHTVSRHRAALELPSRARGERWRAKIAEAARRQLGRLGLASMGQLRAEVLRRKVAASGWPADLRLRHTQVLGLLEERGPMTRRELCAALGLPWIGSRASMKSGDPEGTYLAHLLARGLVVRLGRVYSEGYHYETYYALALDAERRPPDEPGR